MGKKRPKKVHHSYHHRKCRSNGGSSDISNLSLVTTSKHVAFHTLFRNYDAYKIAQILNETWIDMEHELVVRNRKE